MERIISISIDTNVYPMEAIYGTAYVFVDRAYVRLAGDPKGTISVELKSKDEKGFVDKEAIEGEFMNEILNYALRAQISEANKNIREYIVGAALLGISGDTEVHPASIKSTEEDEEECDCEDDKCDCDDDYDCESEGVDDNIWKDDPLGIAVPWEDKYSKGDKDEKAK